jgi:MFS transporter, AAHS family, benzoate transport protein
MKQASPSALDARRLRTVIWIVALATVGLIFDGYDLVVYGTVVSTFLRDPSQIGAVTPSLAGALGSYALIGVLAGALLAGSCGDILGRRKVMLFAYAWFSIGMGITALTTSTPWFGLMRFATGLGVGALVATTGALVAEYAPKGRKNLCNAIVYSGVPLGSLFAAGLAIVLLPVIGWRGMFLIGALPAITLLPLAYGSPRAEDSTRHARSRCARVWSFLPPSPWWEPLPNRWLRTRPGSPDSSARATSCPRWCSA